MYLSGFLFKLFTRTIDKGLSLLCFLLFLNGWVGFNKLGPKLGLIFGQVLRAEREFYEIHFLIIDFTSEVSDGKGGLISADGL